MEILSLSINGNNFCDNFRRWHVGSNPEHQQWRKCIRTPTSLYFNDHATRAVICSRYSIVIRFSSQCLQLGMTDVINLHVLFRINFYKSETKLTTKAGKQTPRLCVVPLSSRSSESVTLLAWLPSFLLPISGKAPHEWRRGVRGKQRWGFSDCKRPLCPGFGLQPGSGSRDVSEQVRSRGTLHKLCPELQILELRVLWSLNYML